VKVCEVHCFKNLVLPRNVSGLIAERAELNLGIYGICDFCSLLDYQFGHKVLVIASFLYRLITVAHRGLLLIT
jgi:hypothetical protein